MRSHRVLIGVVLLISTVALAGGHSPGVASAEPTDDNLPPVAVASVLEDVEDLWENMTVHFSSNGSHDDGGHLVTIWDFGDGSEETVEPNPVHVYITSGPVTVVLTVIDLEGESDSDHLDLYIWRDYGDTDIIIKAHDYRSFRPFVDPWNDVVGYPAVRRDGWVAYLCDLKEGQRMDVTFTVFGDRPADVYLFREEDFSTYRDGAMQVPYEARGTRLNVTGEFEYTYRIGRTGRHYVVIDNRDHPAGTGTRGPVDYSIEIATRPAERGDPDTPWLYIIILLVSIVAAFVLLVNHFGEPVESQSGDR